ncbi:MAG: hypothetical protein A2X60_18210 [Ignavibacteria bacterium GWF2_35_20]|nr:MAG: hypothetical protein A2X60_18210 [Ignavibacteria bacterium GWF2_35_20]
MKKILIIEDDSNVRGNIAALLEEENFAVAIADNGKTGIEKAKEFLPDLIICDVLMPVASGYEVLQELAKSKNTRSIPFIFLTAKVERSDIRLGMELGADDYLFKPFKLEELLNAINSRLSKHEIIIADHVEETSGAHQLKNKKYEIDEKMFLTVNGKPLFVGINEIKYITAENQYSSLKLNSGKSVLIRRSIKKWEDMLPEKYFLRIHRCTIVNLGQIVKMEKWHNASMIIHLKDVNEPFVISKRYTSLIRNMQK